LKNIPDYTRKYWPEAALSKDVETSRTRDLTGDQWITEDEGGKAIWTIVHEVCFTKFNNLRYYLLTYSIAYPYGKVQNPS
jgi:hypothetical protein